jgi:hypothetical protein
MTVGSLPTSGSAVCVKIASDAAGGTPRTEASGGAANPEKSFDAAL